MAMDADEDAARKMPDTKDSHALQNRKGSVPERAPADREFLSAAAGRVGCGISPCQRILRALQPPLRTTSLPGLLRSRHCGTNPALARALGEPSLAFRASRIAPKARLPNPSDPARDSCLPLPRKSKLAPGDAANTSGDDSRLDEPRYDTAKSSANYLGGIHESRERRVGKLPAGRRRRRRNPKECRKPGCTPRRDNR